MPFRESEYKERCSLCDEIADGACARCAKPTCADHRAEAGLCKRCNDEFERRHGADLEPKIRRAFGYIFCSIVTAITAVVYILYVGPEHLLYFFAGAIALAFVSSELLYALNKRAARIERAVRKRQRERFIAGEE